MQTCVIVDRRRLYALDVNQRSSRVALVLWRTMQVVVVSAAGNGNQDLDGPTYEEFRGWVRALDSVRLSGLGCTRNL
jgi:hypothetical protein